MRQQYSKQSPYLRKMGQSEFSKQFKKIERGDEPVHIISIPGNIRRVWNAIRH